MANISETRWSTAVKEHEDLLAALESRDGEKLGRLLRRHLANTCKIVRKAIEDSPTSL